MVAIWSDKKGKLIPVTEMTNTHIANSIKYLVKMKIRLSDDLFSKDVSFKVFEHLQCQMDQKLKDYDKWIAILLTEQQRRKCKGDSHYG